MGPIPSTHGEFDLVVLAGTDADRGARMRVGRQPVVIGRGAGAGLALSDARVSREHAQALGSEAGVIFVVLPEARRPLLYRGERLEKVVVPLGGEVQIGDTVLRVEEARSGERRTDARTLLTGEAEDVRAAAALYGLSDALRPCLNRGSVERAVGEWARSAPVRAIEASLVAIEDSSRVNDASGDDALVVRRHDDVGSIVLVRLHAAPQLQLRLRYALEPDRIADSLKRLLYVAGAIIASRLSAIQVLAGVQQDRDFVRSVAFGRSTTFVGISPAALRLDERIQRLAQANVAVLLTGETGTGKTFVARLLHERGPRANGPFRAVNCAAIPDALLEAELFGNERGAFTGAAAARAGLLEVAGDGTLFLDEIGELSLSGQAKLLRVIEERRFERLGSTKTREFTAQVITATNQDLDGMVKLKRFREDLYYRICAHGIQIPPLRERRDDIVGLAQQFLTDLAPARGRRLRGFSPEAIRALQGHRWPGNVRELRNAVDYAIVAAEGDVVEANALPEAVLAGVAGSPSEGVSVTLPADHAWLDQRNFDAALAKARGNVTKAAELLGMNRVSLHKRLRRTGRAP